MGEPRDAPDRPDDIEESRVIDRDKVVCRDPITGRNLYRPTPSAPAPGKAPSLERGMIDAIEAGLTEGDDLVVEEIDGRPREVLKGGRRVPLDG